MGTNDTMVVVVPHYKVLSFPLNSNSLFRRHLYVRRHRSTDGDSDKCTLFVANVPPGSTCESLCETFSKFGEIKDVVLGGITKGGAQHVAHVVFANERSVERAEASGDVQDSSVKMPVA